MDDLNKNKMAAGGDPNAPIPLEEDISIANVSHSPLNLGGGSVAEVPKVKPATKPEIPKPSAPVAKPPEKTATAERITGVKTFFAKLHVGAVEFLDEQITNWLKSNPDITVKQTNTVVGELQGKKTEPNIIITIWY
jgi:DNA-binding Lrp family transcriptional regulator